MNKIDFLSFQVRSAVIGNYKPERLFDRGEDYGSLVIDGAIEEAIKTGIVRISKWESISGKEIEFKFDYQSGLLLES